MGLRVKNGGGMGRTYPALGRQLWLHMAVSGKSPASPVTLMLKQLVNIRPYSACDLPHQHHEAKTARLGISRPGPYTLHTCCPCHLCRSHCAGVPGRHSPE